jgi:hypothetical protein
MALFYECMLKCARKLLDTADIVREAFYQQPSKLDGSGPHSHTLGWLPTEKSANGQSES